MNELGQVHGCHGAQYLQPWTQRWQVEIPENQKPRKSIANPDTV